MLHKILTAVTALAVVASLLAGAAGQAAAVSGYDSAYFGESAFLTLGPGRTRGMKGIPGIEIRVDGAEHITRTPASG